MFNSKNETMKNEDSLNTFLTQTRLGTCYNNNSRLLLVRQNSFDLEKLNYKKLLLFFDGIAKFELETNSNNNSTYNSSAYSISSKAEGKLFRNKAAAAFDMERSHASANESKNIKASLSYRYLGQGFQIQKASEDTYFSCLLPDCQADLAEIYAATSSKSKLEKYLTFTEKYGHACVTKLFLEAGSIANIEVKAESNSVAHTSKYGMKASLSNRWGNESTAVNWAKELAASDLRGNLYIKAIDYPQNSPTKEWSHALVTNYEGRGFEVLSEKDAFTKLPSPNFERVPLHIGAKETDDKKLPESEPDLSVEIQKKIMEDQGYEGSWEEFIKRQEKALEGIDKYQVVEDAKKVKKSKMLPLQMFKQQRSQRASFALGEVKNSDWDLGGYCPVDYELTPWTELFPSLKAIVAYPATTNIIFAKIMTFYYTRLQFGQYMQFLSDVGDAYKDADNSKYLENDIDIYFQMCESYMNDFINTDEELTESAYLEWLQKFEKELQVLVDQKQFYNHYIYKAFFDKYEVFTKCPYGFTCFGLKNTGNYFDLKAETDEDMLIGNEKRLTLFTNRTELFSIENLGLPTLSKAIRLYPVIKEHKGKGAIGFVYFSDVFEKFLPMEGDINIMVEGLEKPPPFIRDDINSLRARSSYSMEDFQLNEGTITIDLDWYLTNNSGSMKLDIKSVKHKIKCLGFNPFNSDCQDDKLRGATPMFNDFPFNYPKKYAE